MIPLPRQRPRLPQPLRRERAAQFATEAATLPRTPAKGRSLTRRQREVLELLAAGLTAKEIARRLYVTEQTVKTILRAVYRKLGARNAAAAVHRAWQIGYLAAADEEVSA